MGRRAGRQGQAGRAGRQGREELTQLTLPQIRRCAGRPSAAGPWPPSPAQPSPAQPAGSPHHPTPPTHLVDLHDGAHNFTHFPRQGADAHTCRRGRAGRRTRQEQQLRPLGAKAGHACQGRGRDIRDSAGRQQRPPHLPPISPLHTTPHPPIQPTHPASPPRPAHPPSMSTMTSDASWCRPHTRLQAGPTMRQYRSCCCARGSGGGGQAGRRAGRPSGGEPGELAGTHKLTGCQAEHWLHLALPADGLPQLQVRPPADHNGRN